MERTYLRYFFGGIRTALEGLNEDVCEIRLRAGQPPAVGCPRGTFFLTADGGTGAVSNGETAGVLRVTPEDIRRTFEAVCRYSLHSFQQSISRGYVTVPGGHRVGLCGTAVLSADGRVENIRHISGINFRVAREVTGAAEGIAGEMGRYDMDFYTCHCTGQPAFRYLSGRLERMHYLSCGESISL